MKLRSADGVDDECQTSLLGEEAQLLG